MAKRKQHFTKLRAFNWSAPQICAQNTYGIYKTDTGAWELQIPHQGGRWTMAEFLKHNGVLGVNKREYSNFKLPDRYEFFKDVFMIAKELQGSWVDRQIVVYPNPEDVNECVKIDRNELVELQTVLTFT